MNVLYILYPFFPALALLGINQIIHEEMTRSFKLENIFYGLYIQLSKV